MGAPELAALLRGDRGADPAHRGPATLIRIPGLRTVGWIEIAIGLGWLVLLSQSNRERARGLVAILPIAVVGVAAYALIDLAFSLR